MAHSKRDRSPLHSLLGVEREDGFACPLPLPAWTRIAKTRSSYHTVSCHCSHLGSAPGLDWLSPANLRSPTPRRHLAVQTTSGGSGISTGCPSPTTFVLGLGPTNPERTSLPQETLGLRRVRFSLTLRYSCRHSHFRPLQPSSRSTFTADGTLPYHPPNGKPFGRSVASVPGLSPVEFSARIHLTSELLRTLSMMAASEPTSWLSMRIHILYHLAWI
jgi:hypothetical protein